VSALVAYLETELDSDVAVYGTEMPEADASEMPRKAVVVSFAGGMPERGPVNRPRVDIVCYGATPLESQTVFLAAQSAMGSLDRGAHGAALLYDAVQDGGPSSMRQPDTRWPVTWGSFLIQASKTSTEE
jgi:hypothetical protein